MSFNTATLEMNTLGDYIHTGYSFNIVSLGGLYFVASYLSGANVFMWNFITVSNVQMTVQASFTHTATLSTSLDFYLRDSDA